MIIPGIRGATRMVTNGLKKVLKAIPGKHSIDSLQKTARLGTSHIIRKALQSETGSLSSGDYCWFKGSAREKRPVVAAMMMMMMMIIMMIMIMIVVVVMMVVVVVVVAMNKGRRRNGVG
jgi:hypothetical protein